MFSSPEIFRIAAKVILLLNPTNNLKAIEFLTTLDSSFIDQNIKVRLHRLSLSLVYIDGSSFRHVRQSMKTCKQVIMARPKVPCWNDIEVNVIVFGQKPISFKPMSNPYHHHHHHLTRRHLTLRRHRTLLMIRPVARAHSSRTAGRPVLIEAKEANSKYPLLWWLEELFLFVCFLFSFSGFSFLGHTLRVVRFYIVFFFLFVFC